MPRIKSILRYPGGKFRVAKNLVDAMPLDGIGKYVEPFIGGGTVMLEVLSRRPGIKVIAADIDWELINFWQSVQAPDKVLEIMHAAKLLRLKNEDAIRAYITNAKDKKTMTATEFFITNRGSHGGSMRMGGLSPGLTRFTNSAIEKLRGCPAVLQKVIFQRCHYTDILDECDQPNTFFFLDPPYITAKNLYKHSEMDFEGLSRQMACVRSKWMMTIDDCELSRRLWKAFNIKPLPITYGMNNGGKNREQKRATELLITNY